MYLSDRLASEDKDLTGKISGLIVEADSRLSSSSVANLFRTFRIALKSIFLNLLRRSDKRFL